MGRDENLKDLAMIRRLLTLRREGGAFGAKVREQRRAKGMTLEDLAGRTGMAKSYLSQIETGYAPPPRDEKIQRIADALDLSAETLLSTARLSELPGPVKAHLLRLVDEADRALRDLPPKEQAGADETEPADARTPRDGAAGESAPRPPVSLDLDALHRSGLLHHLARADDREAETVPLRPVPIINKVAAG